MCNIAIRLTVKFANFTHFRRAFLRPGRFLAPVIDYQANWSFSKVEKITMDLEGSIVDQLYNLPLV